jgi:hypothetical protein
MTKASKADAESSVILLRANVQRAKRLSFAHTARKKT